jgi:hypothetical protein
MKSTTRIIAAGFVFFVAGCEVPAPTRDTTTPEVTVTVSGARGRNVFRSIDGKLGEKENCIKVPELPTQLILIAGDGGGVQSTSIRAFPAMIVPASVEISPRPPEGTFAIRSDSGGDTLTITLVTTPSPTTVRTGATAILDVNGRLPIAIVASVRDRAGNVAELPQFDLRSMDDAVQCRGR